MVPTLENISQQLLELIVFLQQYQRLKISPYLNRCSVLRENAIPIILESNLGKVVYQILFCTTCIGTFFLSGTW